MQNGLQLDAKWRAWLIENLVGGVPAAQLADELNNAGIEATVDTVASIVASTDLAAVAQLLEATRRRQTIIDLQREMLGKPLVPTEHHLSASDFYRSYFFANRPVVLKGFARGWPAFGQWTHEWFAERHGDVPVQVCQGRLSDPTPDRNVADHVTAMTLGEFLATVKHAGSTNDLYAVSHNKLIERPELAALLDDVHPNPMMFPREHHRPTAAALWIGPDGTRTPLHHDTTNVMLTQMQGTKQIQLASPFETQLVDAAHDFYAEVDVGAPGWGEHFGQVRLAELTLHPGDALFIPVGWWHRVVALEPSISLGLMGFAEPNDYSWYRPGSIAPSSVIKTTPGES